MNEGPIDQDNPYQSPRAVEQASSPSTDRLWREGDYLIVRRSGAALPDDCCARCGESAYFKRLKCTVQDRISPLLIVVLFLLMGPFVLLIVISMTPSSRFTLSLCHRHWTNEVYMRRIIWLLAISGGGLLIVPFFFFDGTNVWPVVPIIFGPILLLAATALAIFRPKLLRAVHSEKQFVWLETVHPVVLAQVPQMPTGD